MFLVSKGNVKISTAMPHPRLLEYNKLTFFWEKFGLNVNDLKDFDPIWVQEMYLVGIGVDKAKNEISSMSKNSTVMLNAGRGARKVEKIL